MGINTSLEETDRMVPGLAQPLRFVDSARLRPLRNEPAIERTNQGVDLVFECGILAICRRCRLSWRIDGNRHSSSEWWLCPARCDGTL